MTGIAILKAYQTGRVWCLAHRVTKSATYYVL